MPNGSANCLLEVCCDPPAAMAKLSSLFVKDTGVSKEYADKCAAWVFEHCDLAPRGSLKAFKAEIARCARENP